MQVTVRMAGPNDAPSLDWTVVGVVGFILVVAAVFAVLAAWLLHRFRGQASLQARTLFAASLPVLCFSLIIMTAVALTQEISFTDAVRQFFRMDVRGLGLLVAMFATSWVVALTVGWLQRRRLAKSNHFDPRVFD